MVQHHDLEICLAVAAGVALNDDVRARFHGVKLALHVVEGLAADEVEGLIAPSRLGIDCP